jgi:hypothetical protein
MKLKALLARVFHREWDPGPSQYRAVTVAHAHRRCEAAQTTLQKPILLRHLPRLPLPGCSMPEQCRCEFREWPDRRIGERRFFESAREVGDQLDQNDKRDCGERRKSSRHSTF